MIIARPWAPGTLFRGPFLVGHQFKRFAKGKTLMPGGFIPPEQIQWGPRGIPDPVGRADKKEPTPAAPAAPDMGGMY